MRAAPVLCCCALVCLHLLRMGIVRILQEVARLGSDAAKLKKESQEAIHNATDVARLRGELEEARCRDSSVRLYWLRASRASAGQRGGEEGVALFQNNGKWLEQACPSESQVRFVLHAALQAELQKMEIERIKAQISARDTTLATYAGMRCLPPDPAAPPVVRVRELQREVDLRAEERVELGVSGR
jgi:hypothetical protein